MKPETREVFAHAANALSRYRAELRRDGIAAPPELAALLVFVADCASTRQSATPLAGSTPVLDGVLMPPVSLLLTKREAASELRISVRQIERLVAAERLRTVHVGRAVRIRRADLDAYVTALTGGRTFREQVEAKTP